MNLPKNRKQKNALVGYELRVSFDGGKSFDPRGGLFGSRYLAVKYHDEKYGSYQSRVSGVRLNFERVVVSERPFDDRFRR